MTCLRREKVQGQGVVKPDSPMGVTESGYLGLHDESGRERHVVERKPHTEQ